MWAGDKNLLGSGVMTKHYSMSCLLMMVTERFLTVGTISKDASHQTKILTGDSVRHVSRSMLMLTHFPCLHSCFLEEGCNSTIFKFQSVQDMQLTFKCILYISFNIFVYDSVLFGNI